MNTLAAHQIEFSEGIVTEGGFSALMDAEIYGNASSIGALSKCLMQLHECLSAGIQLSLYCPRENKTETDQLSVFLNWCEKYFPSAYDLIENSLLTKQSRRTK